LAFSVIGLAGTFYKMFGKKPWSIPAACAVVVTMRFLCHFISGILIWGVYAEKGQSVAVYSLVYNGLYMLPELIITTTAAALLIGVIKRFEQKQSNL